MRLLDPPIGSEVAGYRIEGLLGRGGMGAVYRARDVRLGRDVALKVLPAELAGDERFRERFLRESRLAAAIEHPSIVPIHDASDGEGFLYIAMRLVDGVDLRQLLTREGPLPPARTIALAAQVASALDAAHARGLVHRDVKPSNVLVAGAHAYLCDFGISAAAGALDRSGEPDRLAGTLDYAAPEQIEGHELDGRTDQYALGCLVFECLTGTPPFRRDTPAATLWAHLKASPPPLTAFRGDLPPGLDAALARGLAKEPAERYATCGALVETLAAELAASAGPAAGSGRIGPAALAEHLSEIASAVLDGRLVPMLGPGANASGRPLDYVWTKGDPRFLPDGDEIATHLAERFHCPPELATELVRVSEYVEVMQGSGPLQDELHEVFDADYRPGPVHRLLARLPELLRGAGLPYPLLVTTCYDRALEEALDEAGVDRDVVSYIATGRERGKFSHAEPDGSSRVIAVPNEYARLSLDRRTVVLKMHGQVDRQPERSLESFVVSEDDYIGYLSQTDIGQLVPVTLAARLRRSHVLFLGYDPAAWSQRVALQRLWGDERLRYRSWTVSPRPSGLERELWRRRGVDVVQVPVDHYVEELASRLAERGGTG